MKDIDRLCVDEFCKLFYTIRKNAKPCLLIAKSRAFSQYGNTEKLKGMSYLRKTITNTVKPFNNSQNMLKLFDAIAGIFFAGIQVLCHLIQLHAKPIDKSANPVSGVESARRH